MQKCVRKLLVYVCYTLFVIFALISVYTFNINATASENPPTVQMINGAQIRKTVGEPGIKFTAKISGYEKGQTRYNFGMLIIPKLAFTNEILTMDGNYHKQLEGKVYAGQECSPYQKDCEWYISFSLKNILEENYDLSFVGIAYIYDTVNGQYTYTDVNLSDNARSIAYVAQMALKYETDLVGEQIEALERFSNPNGETVEEEILMDLTDGGYSAVGENISVTNTDNFVKLNFSAYRDNRLGYTTKRAYSNITQISLDVLVPSTNEKNFWWGIVPVADRLSENAYIGMGASASVQNVGEIIESQNWVDVWVTLTYTVSGSRWALSCSPKGSSTVYNANEFDFSGDEFSLNGASYVNISANPSKEESWGIYLDNFSITSNGNTYTDGFDGSKSQLFIENENLEEVASYGHSKTDGYIEIGVSEAIGESNGQDSTESVDYAIIDFNDLPEDKQPLITAEKYTNITKVTVDVFIPSTNTCSGWWGFAPLTSNTGTAYAAQNAVNGKFNINQLLTGYFSWKDQWVTLTYTVSEKNWTLSVKKTGTNQSYLTQKYTALSSTVYFALSAQPKTVGKWCIYVDNLSITTTGGTVYTDSFTGGRSELFTDNVGCLENIEQTTDVNEEEYFDSLIEEGKGVDCVLEALDKRSVKSKTVGDFSGISSSMAVMVGEFSCSFNGYKDLAIVLYKNQTTADYLRINANQIALYNGNNKVKSIEIGGSYNYFKLSVLKDGEVIVSVNSGSYVGLGYLTGAPTQVAIVDILGSGKATVTDLTVTQFVSAQADTQSEQTEIGLLSVASETPSVYNRKQRWVL